MCETHEALKISMKFMQKEFDSYKKEWEVFRLDNKAWHDKLWIWLGEIKDILTAFILEVKTTTITKEEAKKTFASKLTETLVYSTAGTMLTSIVWAIIFLVLR